MVYSQGWLSFGLRWLDVSEAGPDGGLCRVGVLVTELQNRKQSTNRIDGLSVVSPEGQHPEVGIQRELL